MRSTKLLTIILVCAVLSLFTSQAQNAPTSISQFAELIASDGQQNDHLGVAVAINGTTVVVGAPDHNGQRGSAYVFAKQADTIRQVAELAAPSGGIPFTYFGAAVAISGDTVVIGRTGNNQEPGAVYVFVKPANGWADTTPTATLMPSDSAGYDQFGSSVAITGNTIVVGAPRLNTSLPTPGEAYVFMEPPGGWMNMTQTATLTASDGTSYAGFGSSVAINGSTVVVGAPGSQIQQFGQGAGYVFVEPPVGWQDMTETAKLVAFDPQTANLGAATSIEGNTVVLGAPYYSTDFYQQQGAAYVFVEPTGGWRNSLARARLTASNGHAFNAFGSSVATTGNVILVGSPDNLASSTAAGSAYLDVKPLSGWRTTSFFFAQLMASDSAASDDFGTSVAIEHGAAVIGAPGHTVGQNQGQGAAYVFVPQ